MRTGHCALLLMSLTLEQLLKNQQRTPADWLRIKRTIRAWVKKWPWFALSLALAILAAIMYIRYKTPVYKITASLLVRDDMKGSDFGDAIALESLGLPNGKANVDNEIEILKSRSLAASVIQELQLYTTYFVTGKLKTAELDGHSPFKISFITPPKHIPSKGFLDFDIQFPAPDSVLITREGQSWSGACGRPLNTSAGALVVKRTQFQPAADKTYSFRLSDPEQTLKWYLDALTVASLNKQVSMIRLSFTDLIPERGERILRAHIDGYLRNSLQDKNKVADGTVSFIDKNLATVRDELLSTEAYLTEYRRKNRITNLSESSRFLTEIALQQRKEQQDLAVQAIVLDSLQYLISRKNEASVPAAALLADSRLSALLDAYNGLMADRANQLVGATPNHPSVRNIDAQLDALRNTLEQTVGQKIKNLKTQTTALTREENLLRAEIAKIPEKEHVVLDKTRDQQIKQELYVFLLKKRVETSLSRSSTLPNGRLIDPPKANPEPVAPIPRLILLIAVLVGLAIPAIVLYVLQTVDTKIQDIDDIHATTNIPVIASIGRMHEMGEDVFRSPGNPVAEAFRTLRTNLWFTKSPDDRVILVTSAMAGEGKSFVATNLARSTALSGKSVVLLELDLRRPRLAALLSVSGFGVTDYLTGKADINACMHPVQTPPIFALIPCGGTTHHPAELLLDNKVETLITQLKLSYDLVVIDTPPVTLVTDALILSQYADMTLFVTRKGVTDVSQLVKLNELHHASRLPGLHVLLNEVEISSKYAYGYAPSS